MKVKVDTIGQVKVLYLSGRLEAATSDVLKEALQKELKADVKQFVFDLAGIGFVDSSGLGALVGSLRSVNKDGGDIRLAGLTPEVQTVFELTRLHRLFEIFDSPKVAAESF